MTDQIHSVLLGTSGLFVAEAAALLLTILRDRATGDARSLRMCARIGLAAVLVQSGHFVEEASAGFYRRFPQLLGLEAWPLPFFLALNLVCIAAWLAALWWLTTRSRLALLPLWFLGLASVANAVAHPALALWAGGYFPGLVTSPLVGAAGGALLMQLARITGPAGAPAD